jgi:hypothetical protein
MGSELLCTACREFSDNYVLIVEGEMEEKFCVLQVEGLVTIGW